MKIDYSAVDAAIVKAIGEGRRTFMELQSSRSVRPLADSVCPKGDGYRVIDRRLQALRKSGAISQLIRGVWQVTE